LNDILNLLIRLQDVMILFKDTVSKEQVEKYANEVIANGKAFSLGSARTNI
jgi:hypothetical protein